MKRFISQFTQQLFFTADKTTTNKTTTDKTITESQVVEDHSEFRKLPDELITNIASFFDKPEQLGQISSVSTRFNRISQEAMLWKRFGYESKADYVSYLKSLEPQKITFGDIVKLNFLGKSSVNGQPSNKQLFFKQLRQRDEGCSYKRSYGVDFDVIHLNGHLLQLWDMAGQDTFDAMIGVYLKDSDVILVFPQDSQDAKRLLDSIQSAASNRPPIKPRVICLMVEPGSEEVYKSLKSTATYVISLPIKGEGNQKSLNPVEVLQAILAKVGQKEATVEQIRTHVINRK